MKQGRILILLILFPVLVQAQPDLKIKTNVEFLIETARQGLQTIADTLVKAGGKSINDFPVYLEPAKKGSWDWILEQALIKELKKRNLEVVAGVKPAPAISKPQDKPAETVPAGTAVSADSGIGGTKIDSANTTPTDATAAIPIPEPPAGTTPVITEPAPVAAGGLKLEYRITDCYIVYDRAWREKFWGKKQLKRSGKISAHFILTDRADNKVLAETSLNHTASDVVPFKAKPFIENDAYRLLKADLTKSLARQVTEIFLVGGSVGYLVYLFFSQSFN